MLVVAIVGAGCRVDLSTEVVIAADGSGTVTVTAAMDAEAVSALGGVDQLRTADLAAAGWTVAAPVPVEGGGVIVSAVKAFTEPAQLATIFAEIAGPSGFYRTPSFTRSRTTFRDRYEFTAALDVSQALVALDDPALVALLESNGADVEALRTAAAAIPASVGVSLTARLPGGTSRTWTGEPGQVVTAELSGSEVRSGQIGKVAGAVITAGLALVVATVTLARALAGRRRAWRDGFLSSRQRSGSGDEPEGWDGDDWESGAGWDGAEWREPSGAPRHAGSSPGADDVLASAGAPAPTNPAGPRAIDLPPPPPDWDPFGSEPDPRRG
jgi:hypothetical protein